MTEKRNLSNLKIINFIFLTVIFIGLSTMFSLKAKSTQLSYDVSVFPGEILIGFKPNFISRLTQYNLNFGVTGIESIDNLNSMYGVQMLEPLFLDIEPDDFEAITEGLNGVFKVIVPEKTDLMAMIREYETDPHIEYAEPNLKIKLSKWGAGNDLEAEGEQAGGIIPDDPKFGRQWSLNNKKKDADINAPEAWEIEKGNNKVVIAIVDSGVNYMHEDLDDGRVLTDIDKDFFNGDKDAMDDMGYGTSAAGVIAAVTNNNIGIAGICWECSILPIKVIGYDEYGDEAGSIEWLAKGIKYAAKKKAHIINIGVRWPGVYGCSKTVAKTINYAWKKKCLLIAAAGDDKQEELDYPAGSPRVMAVGATNKQDKLAKTSNQGEGLDVVAPGWKVLSLGLGDTEYKKESNSAIAAAHVSGVAGLILSHNLELNAGEVWWILHQSADDLGSEGWDKEYGWGRINALKALTIDPAGKIEPPKDKCKGEPECTATVALRGEKESDLLINMLHIIRDEHFTKSAVGRRWTRLYNRNSEEVVSLILKDKDLRVKIKECLIKFIPIFRVMMDGDLEETSEVLTFGQIDAFYTVMNRLIMIGSDQLRDNIISELERLDPSKLIGLDIKRVWNKIESEGQY